MFDKYKRNAVKFILEGLFFSSDIKNDREHWRRINFVTCNTGYLLNFSIKLMDGKNKDKEFEKGKKKF